MAVDCKHVFKDNVAKVNKRAIITAANHGLSDFYGTNTKQKACSDKKISLSFPLPSRL